MPRRRKGTGSISFSGGRYVGSVTIRPGQRKSFYGPRGDDSAGARANVSAQIDAFLARNPKDVSRLSIVSCVYDYIEHGRTRSGTLLREPTRAWYRSHAKTYLVDTPFGNKAIGAISRKDARRYLEGLDAPIHARRAIQALLHRTMSVAMERDDIKENPFSLIPKPRAPKSIARSYQPQEMLLLLRAARRDRYFPVILLTLTTTMGPAEMFGLQWSDVNVQGRFLTVTSDLVEVGGVVHLGPTKNAHRTRRIDLPDVTIRAIEAMPKVSSYVFTSPKGKPIRRTVFRNRVWIPLLNRAAALAERYARRHGQPEYRFPRLRMYDLRHSAGAVMGFLDIPIQVVQQRMGHASIMQTADTYGHLFASMNRDAADTIDGFFSPALRGPTRSAR